MSTTPNLAEVVLAVLRETYRDQPAGLALIEEHLDATALDRIIRSEIEALPATRLVEKEMDRVLDDDPGIVDEHDLAAKVAPVARGAFADALEGEGQERLLYRVIARAIDVAGLPRSG